MSSAFMRCLKVLRLEGIEGTEPLIDPDPSRQIKTQVTTRNSTDYIRA